MVVNLKQDLVYTFAAQGMNILLNLVLTLLVPKILGVEDYSYWQLFILFGREFIIPLYLQKRI